MSKTIGWDISVLENELAKATMFLEEIPSLLDFGNGVQCQGSLAGRLRAVYLGHPANRDAPDADCNVKAQCPCRNCRYYFNIMGPHPHD